MAGAWKCCDLAVLLMPKYWLGANSTTKFSWWGAQLHVAGRGNDRGVLVVVGGFVLGSREEYHHAVCAQGVAATRVCCRARPSP